jgi:hypothetical protein
MQRGKIARRDRETPLSWLTEARNESSWSTCTTLVGKHAIRLQCQIRKQNHCPQLDTGRSSSGSKRAPVCREASSLPVGHVGTMCTIFEKFKVAKIVSGLDFFFEYPTGRRRDIPPSPPLLSKHVDQRRSSVGERKAEGAKSRQHPIHSTTYHQALSHRRPIINLCKPAVEAGWCIVARSCAVAVWHVHVV